MPGWLLMAAVGWYAAWSVAAVAAFGIDKRDARLGNRRTPEKTLHALSFAGGFPGSLAAMRLFKHKRRKTGFVIVTWAAAILHAGLWIVILRRL